MSHIHESVNPFRKYNNYKQILKTELRLYEGKIDRNEARNNSTIMRYSMPHLQQWIE